DEASAEDVGALPRNDAGVEDVALREGDELTPFEDVVLGAAEHLAHAQAQPGTELGDLEGAVDAPAEGLEGFALLGRQIVAAGLEVDPDRRPSGAVQRPVEEEVLHEGAHPRLEAAVLLVGLPDALEVRAAQITCPVTRARPKTQAIGAPSAEDCSFSPSSLGPTCRAGDNPATSRSSSARPSSPPASRPRLLTPAIPPRPPSSTCAIIYSFKIVRDSGQRKAATRRRRHHGPIPLSTTERPQ